MREPDKQTLALKATLVTSIVQRMKELNITQTELARRIDTSRPVVQRLLDPINTSLTLTTLAKAAAALGCRLSIQITKETK